MPGFDQDRPFGGVLGSTAELRVLDLLLSVPRHAFNISELARAASVSRGTCDRVAKHLVGWEMLEVDGGQGNVTCFRVNERSPHVAALRDFHFASLGTRESVGIQVLATSWDPGASVLGSTNACGGPATPSVWASQVVSGFSGVVANMSVGPHRLDPSRVGTSAEVVRAV